MQVSSEPARLARSARFGRPALRGPLDILRRDRRLTWARVELLGLVVLTRTRAFRINLWRAAQRVAIARASAAPGLISPTSAPLDSPSSADPQPDGGSARLAGAHVSFHRHLSRWSAFSTRVAVITSAASSSCARDDRTPVAASLSRPFSPPPPVLSDAPVRPPALAGDVRAAGPPSLRSRRAPMSWLCRQVNPVLTRSSRSTGGVPSVSVRRRLIASAPSRIISAFDPFPKRRSRWLTIPPLHELRAEVARHFSATSSGRFPSIDDSCLPTASCFFGA